MISNFLGNVDAPLRASPIISTNELLAREGVNLQKGMNFRDDSVALSVFLVLPPREGEYKDKWHEETQVYVYEGHDSTTVESGKSLDQLMMYESGRLTDNGKFYKAANAFKDGVRAESLQIQVYEKLDPGVWFDKGIFNLVDAKHVAEEGRKVFKFHLTPADSVLDPADRDPHRGERMIPAAAKVEVWKRDNGRCAECGEESGLRFVADGGDDAAHVRLLCVGHAS